MGPLPNRDDLWRRIERLERRIGDIERTSTLSSASISRGNLTVREGGSIRIIDGGNLIGEGGGTIDWEGDAHFGGDTSIDGTTTIGGDTTVNGSLTGSGSGTLDWAGNAHFGGDTVIDGNTTLGGNLEFAPGVIPPEALSFRTESQTFNEQDQQNGGTAFTISLNVSPPAWVATTSILATGTVYGYSDQGLPGRFLARIEINGSGPDPSTVTFNENGSAAAPATFSQDIAGTSSISIDLIAGAPVSQPLATWESSLTALAIFTN